MVLQGAALRAALATWPPEGWLDGAIGMAKPISTPLSRMGSGPLPSVPCAAAPRPTTAGLAGQLGVGPVRPVGAAQPEAGSVQRASPGPGAPPPHGAGYQRLLRAAPAGATLPQAAHALHAGGWGIGRGGGRQGGAASMDQVARSQLGGDRPAGSTHPGGSSSAGLPHRELARQAGRSWRYAMLACSRCVGQQSGSSNHAPAPAVRSLLCLTPTPPCPSLALPRAP